jgi:D-arginine dehydrogenase
MTHDIAIIGAGIVGAALACHLSAPALGRAGPRVLLLEAEPAAGYHTTGRSAALYSSGYGPPQVRALTRASRGFFLQPPAGFSEPALWHPRGALFAAQAHDAGLAEAEHASLLSKGVASRLLDTDEVLALMPVLKPEHAALGVYVAEDFDLDVDALLQGFLRAARRNGVSFVREARVTALERSAGRWRIDTPAGRFEASRVVNAAGAWADEVARLAGVPPQRVEPRRRTAFVFAPPDGVDASAWPAVVAMDESWYLKPDAGLLLGSPANADPTHAHDVLPEELDVATGIHRIEAATTLTIRRPRRSWAGLRCFSPDGEPVAGPDPSEESFWWAAGVGGYGIQSAPAFGRLLAALMLGDGVPEYLLQEGLDAAVIAPRVS